MDNFEKILTIENEITANLLEDILESENIPHILISYHDTAFDGLYQIQYAWGHIEAPMTYSFRIKKIYRELLNLNEVKKQNK